MEPKITVVTVTCNCADVLQATIDSVAEQIYPNVEYIVVDGGSTDGTVEVIRANASKIARWISEPDRGIYDAMNKSVAMASGEWINFMNAGDTFHSPTVVAEIVRHANPKSDIIYGDTLMINKVACYVRKCPAITTMAHDMVFGHQASFTRRSLLCSMPFDTSFRITADYNFFYQAYMRTFVFQYVDMVVADYDCDDGISANNVLRLVSEQARVKGLSHKMSWRVSHCIFGVTYKFKCWIKSMLPQSVRTRLKKRGIAKQNQR